jgi:hypothetical protein
MLSNTDGPSLLLASGGGGTSIDAGSVNTYDNDKFHAPPLKKAAMSFKYSSIVFLGTGSLSQLQRKPTTQKWCTKILQKQTRDNLGLIVGVLA